MTPCKMISMQLILECGHCKAINEVDQKYDDDASKLDAEGIRCWSCGKESIFETLYDFAKLSGQKHFEIVEGKSGA